MAIFAYKYDDHRLSTIIDLLTNEGLLTYNPKASTASADEQRRARQLDKLHKKGAVFAVRDKSNFEDGVKGFIITSKETLLKKADSISHFTPNIFRKYYYNDEKRKTIKGFEEKNLLQINTFVVDIDTRKHSVNDILLACVDHSIGAPTFVLKTTRGYQVFFVLEQPIYISKERQYISLTVAKRIAENIKRSLACVDADPYCNDFGFFRMPNSQNIVHFNETALYTPKQLIDWSQRQDDDLGRLLYVIPGKKRNTSLLKTDWFACMLQQTNVKGKKGQLGRNNYLFTLALACYQDALPKQEAFDLLDQFNSNLAKPLETKDLGVLLESAYSGNYHGPKKEYVEQLIQAYAPQYAGMDISFGQTGWYKFKKPREARQRSHFNEWEQDIIQWIKAQKSASEPFIWRTQKELCAQIGIANSSLNHLLKQSKKLLKTTVGIGRNAKTGWTTVELYIEYIIWLKKENAAKHAETIRQIVQEDVENLVANVAAKEVKKYIRHMQREEHFTDQLTMLELFRGTG